jgi:hypothetical protein
MVEAAGTKVSMDGKGRAIDNIFTERLWRSTKWENVYLADYSNVTEADQGLGDYSISIIIAGRINPLTTELQAGFTSVNKH